MDDNTMTRDNGELAKSNQVKTQADTKIAPTNFIQRADNRRSARATRSKLTSAHFSPSLPSSAVG